MYSRKYYQHFTSPQNSGILENPDGDVEVKHEGGGCLDRIRMTMKTDGQVVQDLKYMLRACSGAIAASSAVTSLAIGKPLDEAEKISVEDVIGELDGVPDKKMHSVELAVEALHSVIADYRKENS